MILNEYIKKENKIEIPQHILDRVPKRLKKFNVPNKLVPLIVELDEKVSEFDPDYEIIQIKVEGKKLSISLGFSDHLSNRRFAACMDLTEMFEAEGTKILKGDKI